MLVKSTIPHYDGTNTLREKDDEYELTAEPELSLRLKDLMVIPVPEPNDTDR